MGQKGRKGGRRFGVGNSFLRHMQTGITSMRCSRGE